MIRDLTGLSDDLLDLLVIGGGVTGAWVARDAAQRGLRVGLVERADFGAGASAQCFRTIHGGLRYLQRLELLGARRSIRERSMWLRVAPHLVEPLPFLVPTYRRGAARRPLLRAALAVIDLMGRDRNRGLDPARHLPPGHALSRREALERAPEIDDPDLTGAVVFHDAQMYSPTRLVLDIVCAAEQDGAALANHVEARAITASRDGLRVRCTDLLSGGALDIHTRSLVNATGAQALHLAGQWGLDGASPDVTLSVALNLVVDHPVHDVAFTVAGRTSDPGSVVHMGARRLFVAPWRSRTLIGTAHYRMAPSAVLDTALYVERFLEEVNAPGTGLRIRSDQVLGVQHGLLPALRTAPTEPVRLLRHDRITDHASSGTPGAFSVLPVKFTTARWVAQETVGRVFRFLENSVPPCRTADTPLPGGRLSSWSELTRQADEEVGFLPTDCRAHLLHTHGARFRDVLALAADRPELLERIEVDSPVFGAQLAYGAECEMACTIADLLERRTELAVRGPASPAARTRAQAILAAVTGRGGDASSRAMGPGETPAAGR